MQQLITFHFHVNVLFQLRLLLQRLLWHLRGAGETHDNDADVIQAALQRETRHFQFMTRTQMENTELHLTQVETEITAGHFYFTFYSFIYMYNF